MSKGSLQMGTTRRCAWPVSNWKFDLARSAPEFKVKHGMISNVNGSLCRLSKALKWTRPTSPLLPSKHPLTLPRWQLGTRSATGIKWSGKVVDNQ
jgi:hypothetical protein